MARLGDVMGNWLRGDPYWFEEAIFDFGDKHHLAGIALGALMSRDPCNGDLFASPRVRPFREKPQ